MTTTWKTMSKTTTNSDKQPKEAAFVQELKEKGSVTLTASTREELAGMVDEIPASVKYSAGAVGRSKENGLFSLRIDLNN